MIRELLLASGIQKDLAWLYVYGSLKEEVIPQLGVTSRHLQQTLGTEWGRGLIAEDLWVRLAHQKVLECLASWKPVVIDDVRMPNEVALVRKLGGVTMHIHREGAEAGADTHWSERALQGFKPNISIINDGSIHDLHFKVWSAVADWRANDFTHRCSEPAEDCPPRS